ncbi:MAG: hypothetical protein NTY53_16190 [Kiritimatiellaeota bacterium]|nr:hypothetical protein [Kiritimatiellota bacterium]
MSRSFDLVLNGRLQLTISNWAIINRGCIDGKTSRLEDKLRLFAGHIADAADSLHWEAIQRAEYERRRIAEAERLAREKRRQDAREDCEQCFDEAVGKWSRYQEEKRFLSRCRKRLLDARIDLGGSSESAQWFRWARNHIEQTNPVRRGFPLHESVSAFLVADADDDASLETE